MLLQCLNWQYSVSSTSLVTNRHDSNRFTYRINWNRLFPALVNNETTLSPICSLYEIILQMLQAYNKSHVYLFSSVCSFSYTSISHLLQNHGSVSNPVKFHLPSYSFHIKCDRGSVLAPVIFIIYITPSIPLFHLSMNYHLYVDDPQLFFS